MAITNANNLWMGDLEPYMDEVFVTSAFAAMGEKILNVKIMKNKSTGMNAGYCFLEFETPSAADTALKKLNGLPVPGTNPIKRFKLNYAVYGKDHGHGTELSLYVGDLTPNVTDHMLLVFFQARYPSVRAAKVVLDSTGKSKRFGFVRFFEPAEHQRAFYEMQGAVGLGGKPIKVNAAVQKGQTKAPNDATSTMNQYHQHYYQQYQQYLASFYQQTGAYHQQPISIEQYYSQSHAAQSNQDYAEDDQELVEPRLELNVREMNKELIEAEKNLFYELESARWNPLETFASSVPTPKVLT